MRHLKRVLLLVSLVTASALALAWLYRPGLASYEAHLFEPAEDAACAERLSATWLGVTALLLRDCKHAILIDPFFSRPPGFLNMVRNREIAPDEALIAEWLKRLNIQKLAAVLVSHSHFDHAMDAGVVARLTGAQLLGSTSTLNIGRGAGLPESQLTLVHSGETYPLGSFDVRFIANEHAGATGGKPTGDIAAPLIPPARYLDYKLGGAWSIVVAHPSGTLLHHGSAGFIPGALKAQRANVAFLGVALIDDLDAYLRETVDAVGATRVIPTHWDDFTRKLAQPLEPFPVVVRLDRFFEDMARLRPKVQVQTMALGQPVNLFEKR
ncbi:MAG: MBL fold metallo-hydrolase [Panacagrimonas sp.]